MSSPQPSANLLLFAFGCLVLVIGAWSETGITGQDEYWLSLRTPLEMLERGSWWTPWLNGAPRLEKPPLLYWLIAASYATLGVDLLSARLWGVLAGAGLAVVTACIHRRLFGTNGTLAGLIALSAVGVAVEARRAMLDLPMGLLAMWSVAAALRWASSATRPPGVLLGSALLLGLSMLTKGPVALLFVGGAAVAAVLSCRGGNRVAPRPRVPVVLQWLLALGVLAAVVLPWPLSMAAMWPDAAAEVLARESGSRHLSWFRPKSIGPVFGGSFGAMIPWSVAALGALWFALRGGGAGAVAGAAAAAARGRRMLLLWCLFSALPFLFIKTFERYLIPLVCPLSILTAHYLAQATPRTRRVQLAVAVSVVGVPVLVLCAFTLWFGLALLWPLVTLGLWGLLLRGALRELRLHTAAAGLALLVALALGVVYPRIGVNRLPRALPAAVLEQPAAVYLGTRPAMLSLRQGRSVHAIRDGQPLGEALAGFGGHVFVEAHDVPRFRAEAAAAAIPVARAGSFRSFYARKVFLRFARRGAGWAEWRQAIAERSLARLQPEFVYFRVGHG